MVKLVAVANALSSKQSEYYRENTDHVIPEKQMDEVIPTLFDQAIKLADKLLLVPDLENTYNYI